uniref:Uncharacterized protein n=1 Tax=Ignisphaera aggregans TaxID=334771 RepID=A0A7C2Z8X5_9CREN
MTTTDSYPILRLPPRIKILEALGCIADGRIKMLSDREALVISSEGTRKYYVYVDLERGLAYSNDNGTKFKKYIGYPIIAFLMLRNAVTFDENLARSLSGIPWKKLNETYKRYSIVETIILQEVKSKGINESFIQEFVDRVIKELAQLKLRYIEMASPDDLL